MAFGIEVYAPNGNTLISISSRLPRFVQNGTFLLNANTPLNINVPGMANNDSWDVFLTPNIELDQINLTLNTGFFTARRISSSGNNTILYWVLRS